MKTTWSFAIKFIKKEYNASVVSSVFLNLALGIIFHLQ